VDSDAPLARIDVRVPCPSEGVFLRELAPKLRGRFWVHSELPLTAGDKVALIVSLEGTSRLLAGTARVLSNQPNRLCLRLVALEASSMQFQLGGDGAVIEDVLLPGIYQEGPHPFTEAPTPPHGVKVRQLLVDATKPRPEQATVVQSTAYGALVQSSAAPEATRAWSGGLRPLDTLGNYQLLERLGRGGMAEVYVARAVIDGGVEKLVALKLVLPEYGPGTEHGGLFLNEARISASLQHRGLIQVFDFGEAAGRPFLAMEYVHGRDLATLMKAKKLPKAFALKVVHEMLLALEYLHARVDATGRHLRLVHRDISPGNVLVSEFGAVKVVDFGVASMHAEAGSAPHLVVGKAGYMPLEQSRGEPPEPQWDLFATGQVLREMIAPEPSPAAAKAVDPEPARRWQSAKEMADAVARELEQAGPVDLGAVVRETCSDALAEEKRVVGEVTVKARRLRPAKRHPLRELVRAASRTAVGKQLAARPMVATAAALSLGVLIAVLGGVVAKQVLRARALERQLDLVDVRMRQGPLSGPGETALAALAQARSQAPQDPRVRARAEELARVFEMLGDVALARGNDSEAAEHFEALALADPGRPGQLDKLIAAHEKLHH
jgi:hypothetical protein